jgi:hypothetical protein
VAAARDVTDGAGVAKVRDALGADSPAPLSA